MQQHHSSSRSPTRDGGGGSAMTRIYVMVSMCTTARLPVAPLPMRSSCLTRQPIRHCTFPPMTTDRPTVAGTATTVLSADLSYLVRRRIFLYLGILIVMLAFGAPGSGLIDIPIAALPSRR